jgi:glucoamylase
MPNDVRHAPGWPGIEPRWTTSAKSAVGTAFGEASRVWFTASHGILNEVYYPEVDSACLRDAGLLVSSADGFRSEEKRHCLHTVEWLAPGIPAFRLTNRCAVGRFVIVKRICCSPDYDVVLQQVHFEPLHGTLADYELLLLMAPHLGNQGAANTAWSGMSKGDPTLYARRDGLALAVICDVGWKERTVGFVGEHDAWNDVMANGRLTKTYDRAEDGNTSLAATVDLSACGGRFTIAIGLGPDPDTAATHARAALHDPYDLTERRYADSWRTWQASLLALDEPTSASEPQLYRVSTAVMRTHLTSNTDGGIIASLSIPWGDTMGDGDLGGYHLVWPRDMVQSASAFVAVRAFAEVRSMLRFLAVTQEADGHWPQNMWLSGLPFWSGLQLDEASFPILLVDLARREGAIETGEEAGYWPMVQRAASFVAMHGPGSEQDRWEEEAGFSPFTLAVEISALLAAADLAEAHGEADFATHLRDTADDWNDSIERWTYVEQTPLAVRVGVRGYYVRISTSDGADPVPTTLGRIRVNNRPADRSDIDASALVSVDALALVRFGLRAADDPRIVDTVKVIDELLRTETATGPTWHRYNEDGYGEHEDGSPYDGIGIGRGWPLLAGERAHVELAAGRRAEAERLAATMRAQVNGGGLLPEQIWDADDVPERELTNGHASGSAMPLVWAHAEYVKLLRSLSDGRIFDQPPQTVARYAGGARRPRVVAWRLTAARRELKAGRVLRIDTPSPARIRWSSDGWGTWQDLETRIVSNGVHAAEVPTAALAQGTTVSFTLYWPAGDRWEGKNFDVRIGPA